jgi:hypothetical protein
MSGHNFETLAGYMKHLAAIHAAPQESYLTGRNFTALACLDRSRLQQKPPVMTGRNEVVGGVAGYTCPLVVEVGVF